MEGKYCQSCAMPMGAEEMYGKNADGSVNGDYCKYCFENGAFTADCSMEEMIDFCVPHMVSANAGMSAQDAKKSMLEFFPTLKRWKAN